MATLGEAEGSCPVCNNIYLYFSIFKWSNLACLLQKGARGREEGPAPGSAEGLAAQCVAGRAGRGSGPALSRGGCGFRTSWGQRGRSVTGDRAENRVTETDWPGISMTDYFHSDDFGVTWG